MFKNTAKSLLFVSLFLLTIGLTEVAEARSFSSTSSPSSTPSSSRSFSSTPTPTTRSFSSTPSPTTRSFSSTPSPTTRSTVSTPSPSNVKVNNVTNTNRQTSMSINSNSQVPSGPVRASYTPISKPQVVANTSPANTTVINRTYTVSNPTNLPTQRVYVTRYDSSNRSYSMPVIVPMGYNTSTMYVPNDYYPATTSRTTVVDNTPTNAFDVMLVFVVLGVFGFIIFVFTRR